MGERSMKRSDAIQTIKAAIDSYLAVPSDKIDTDFMASSILNKVEEMGMRPPPVSEEDAQAIMSIYYAGYTLNQWDEDLAKDEQVAEAKKRRAEAKVTRRAKLADRIAARKKETGNE